MSAISLIPSAACVIAKLGGDFRGEPETLQSRLDPESRALIAAAFEDLGGAPVLDCHAHLVGTGVDDTGAAVDHRMLTWRHPLERIKARVFFSAAGVRDIRHFDGEYVERLVRLAEGFAYPSKIQIVAIDHHYNADGTIDSKRTAFYVPNEYAVATARRHPDLFVPVISVHPDRPNALAELEKWAAEGVRFVKWLPNAQGIDPSDPRHDRFYRRLRDLNMVLLTHTGAEAAVDAAAGQEYGNPLRLRRALDLGVTVIMAHCASRGKSADLDQPGKRAENFDLFMRLMEDPRYRGLAFGDISAIAQWNRLPRPLLTLLRRPDIAARLVNGSDYPMPAINATISLRRLVRLGLLTSRERRALRTIYAYNPLLFDFVLKRTLRDPDTGARLPPSIFMAGREGWESRKDDPCSRPGAAGAREPLLPTPRT